MLRYLRLTRSPCELMESRMFGELHVIISEEKKSCIFCMSDSLSLFQGIRFCELFSTLTSRSTTLKTCFFFVGDLGREEIVFLTAFPRLCFEMYPELENGLSVCFAIRFFSRHVWHRACFDYCKSSFHFHLMIVFSCELVMYWLLVFLASSFHYRPFFSHCQLSSIYFLWRPIEEKRNWFKWRQCDDEESVDLNTTGSQYNQLLLIWFVTRVIFDFKVSK